MRNRSFASSLAVAAMLAIAPPAWSSTVRVTITFGPPKIEAAAAGFALVTFPATVQAGKPGEPSYPFRSVQALLPPGESVSRSTVRRSGWTLVEGSNKLLPAQETVPADEIDLAKQRFLYRSSAYE
ncbi:MAG TPA: hypothetical protein VMT60_01470, partial [Candidatus Bathyarchaeia archaeon]|nr:hypothetical protein [Candidatus Bathyarchaeia archaeon]